MKERIFYCSKCGVEVRDDEKIIISAKVTKLGLEEYCEICTAEIRYPGIKAYVEGLINKAIDKKPLSQKEMDLIKTAMEGMNTEELN